MDQRNRKSGALVAARDKRKRGPRGAGTLGSTRAECDSSDSDMDAPDPLQGDGDPWPRSFPAGRGSASGHPASAVPAASPAGSGSGGGTISSAASAAAAAAFAAATADATMTPLGEVRSVTTTTPVPRTPGVEVRTTTHGALVFTDQSAGGPGCSLLTPGPRDKRPTCETPERVAKAKSHGPTAAVPACPMPLLAGSATGGTAAVTATAPASTNSVDLSAQLGIVFEKLSAKNDASTNCLQTQLLELQATQAVQVQRMDNMHRAQEEISHRVGTHKREVDAHVSRIDRRVDELSAKVATLGQASPLASSAGGPPRDARIVMTVGGFPENMRRQVLADWLSAKMAELQPEGYVEAWAPFRVGNRGKIRFGSWQALEKFARTNPSAEYQDRVTGMTHRLWFGRERTKEEAEKIRPLMRGAAALRQCLGDRANQVEYEVTFGKLLVGQDLVGIRQWVEGAWRVVWSEDLLARHQLSAARLADLMVEGA